MTPFVAAIAIASGRRGALVTAAVLASPHVVPAWLTMAALIAWSRRRPTHEDAEVAFFSSAAAHLSAGLPLREALVRAGDPAHLGLDGFRR
ncbi:MAG: hypothetical protein HKN46_09980, partial [Acidimicrobiia bacterium]|nr:hypothetical protein [Acidimicrobiia bacterium]